MNATLHFNDITNRDRKTNPVLFGDVLLSEGREFTVLKNSNLGVYGILNNKDQQQTQITSYPDLETMHKQGFQIDKQLVSLDQEIQSLGLFAPRILSDGSYAALSRLVSATAICVDFDDFSPFESRYCFGHTAIMSASMLAAFWLSKFNTKESLPIGNVAFRGHLGTEPIADPELTNSYYEKMFALKYEPLIEGMDMRGHANKAMNDYLFPIITTPTREITYEK